MKTISGILLAMSSLTAFAQFPSPANFDFSYEYIMIDQSGYCADQSVYGPTYCSHFSWSVPDTNSISSALEYYNLYYNDYWSSGTTVLASVTDTIFEMEIGIMGEIWVTAVYSNPDGESDPSNSIINDDLPISVNEILSPNNLIVYYNNKFQEIIIRNGEGVTNYNLFDSQGKLIKSQRLTNDRINDEKYNNSNSISVFSTKRYWTNYSILLYCTGQHCSKIYFGCGQACSSENISQ